MNIPLFLFKVKSNTVCCPQIEQTAENRGLREEYPIRILISLIVSDPREKENFLLVLYSPFTMLLLRVLIPQAMLLILISLNRFYSGI